MGVKGFFARIIGNSYAKHTVKNIKKKKEIVSIKKTSTALNNIKLKTEIRIFLFGIVVTILFLIVYGYLIYLNININSIRHVIIYSILSALLIVSVVIDIVLNPFRRSKMGKKKKKKINYLRGVKKEYILMFQILTKLTSLGFMLYDIFTVDSSLKRLLMFGASTLALVVQLIFIYMSKLLVSYYEKMLVAIDSDIQDSGIIDYLNKMKVLEKKISLIENLDKDSIKRINKDFEKQEKIDKVSSRNTENEHLKDICSYCITNNSTIDDVKTKFNHNQKENQNLLGELVKLKILNIKGKKIEMLVVDMDEISNMIDSR